MRKLTQTLEQRFSSLFSSRQHRLARPLWRGLARLNQIGAIERLWQGCRHLTGLAFVDAVLRALDCRYLVDQPKYWGSRSLDYLWIGIGAWLRAHPHVRHLFGAVSISAALPLPAREWLVAYYAHYYGFASSARALHPFCYSAAPPTFDGLDSDAGMRLLKHNLAAVGARVPTLYKQYTELCEPGGARFLAFGVDSEFADSLDGLIWVDLDRVTPKKRQRYLGAEAAAATPPRSVAA